MRYLTGCVQDWPALFSEAYRCIKPGGYIESFDARALYESDDGTVPERSALAQWAKLAEEGGKILGTSFDLITNDTQRRGIEDAGFVVVGERDVKVCFPGGREPLRRPPPDRSSAVASRPGRALLWRLFPAWPSVCLPRWNTAECIYVANYSTRYRLARGPRTRI